MLSSAVSNATAGEIQRAVEFLLFARSVRIGKHDLRRKGRRSAALKNRDHNKRQS
jgi:hypothetical protein